MRTMNRDRDNHEADREGRVDSGVYIAVFRVDRRLRTRVGHLGGCTFKRDVYLYVGSAQRNLRARLARHARRDKPLRWHIDFLSAQAIMLGAAMYPGPKSRECELADWLRGRLATAIPRFGSSDCRCPGHLFYARSRRRAEAGLADLGHQLVPTAELIAD
jgi:sugar fermentation stimulation protein A